MLEGRGRVLDWPGSVADVTKDIGVIIGGRLVALPIGGY